MANYEKLAAGAGAHDDDDDLVDEEHLARKVNRTTSFVRFLVVLALLGGLGYGLFYGYTVGNRVYHELQYREQLARLKNEFLLRAGLVNEIDEPEKYVDARKGLISWYFQKLRKLEVDFAQFPELWDIDLKMKELDEKTRKGLIDKTKRASFDRAFALAREAFNTLKSGEYQVAASAYGKASRLDFTRISRQKVNDADRIKLDLFYWGMNEGVGYGDITVSLLNEQGNEFGSMSGGGAPELILASPENQIEQFPPGVGFGFYTLDPLPFLTQAVTLTFGYSANTVTGERAEWAFKFEKLPVPESWKLAEDANWDRAEAENLDVDLRTDQQKAMTAKERMEAAVKEANRRAAEEAAEKR